MLQVMIENVERYYPFLTRDVISYNAVSPYELVIKTADGKNTLYNDRKKTFRRLSPDDDISLDSFKNEFGLKLCKLLDDNCYTQEELSRDTGISQSTISSYITGRMSPSLYNAYLIARALGCSLDDFIYNFKSYR